MSEFSFKKSLGQNFLIDNNIKDKIINASSITKDSLIIEVGAGSGSLTKRLVLLGVPVISFEIDSRLTDKLNEIKKEYDNLTLVFGDFLSADLGLILSNFRYKKVHLIANLPYYITTPIINKVMNEVSIDEMIIMVQKEVGNRFKALPNTKDYSSLSVFLQYYFDITKVTDVSRNSFVPKPNVDSIVVKFTRKKDKLYLEDEDLFFKLVRDAFVHKRKNLRNNLGSYDLDKLSEALGNIGKDLTYRAEQLTVLDFVFVANYLCS